MKTLKKICHYFIGTTFNYLLFVCFWLEKMQDITSLPGTESVCPVVEAWSQNTELSRKSKISCYL